MGEKLKALWAYIVNDLKVLWAKDKVYIIGAAVLLVVVKGRDIFIDLLVSNAKKTMSDAQKKDDQLAAQEKTANDAANKLIADAQKLGENKPPVGDDWNTK